MRRLKTRRDDGSTLVALLFIVVVCGALSAAVVMINLAAQKEAGALLARERAFQLAEAGVDWTIAEIRKNGSPLLPDPITTVNAHSTGDFVIRTRRGNTNGLDDNNNGVIDEDAEESIVQILSTGRSGGIERTLQVSLQESIEIPTMSGSMQFNVDFPIVDLRGNAFVVDGNDHFLDGTPDPSKPAVYGLSSPASPTYIEDQMASRNFDQVIGAGPTTPSIGSADPIDLDRIVDSAKGSAAIVLNDGETVSNMAMGTATRAGVTVVYGAGDIHLSGNIEGAGMLAVDGDLIITGSFSWTGVVMVRGRVDFRGGGSTKRVIGAMVVGEEVTSNSNSAEAAINGTVDLVYSSDAINLALQSIATMQVMSWQEVGNP